MQIANRKSQKCKSKFKIFNLLFFAFVLLSMFFVLDKAKALSDECLQSPPLDLLRQGKLEACVDEIRQNAAALKPAHERNQQELADLKKQLTTLQSQINNLNRRISVLGQDINQREEDVALQELLLEERVRSFYIRSRRFSPFLVFLSSSNATDLTRTLALQGQEAAEDKRIIEGISSQIAQLKSDRENLKKNKEGLARVQADVDKKAEFLKGEVAKVESYLAVLSAKQQEILAAKAGSFITSVGDIELADDYNASIKGFREAAPSGSFAVFSFGGYTHRKGMSQYGARGRAENGQNYRQILQAYYGKEPVGKDTGGAISVSGYGSLDFETTYLYGIAEMPSTWNTEALKAQAIAARTYAYRYKVEGKTICTTESCQVFSKSKSDNPPSSWKDAVDSTRGQVLEDVVTYYASTSGGYLTTMGWDTTDGSGGGNFIDKTWESKGGSPWLYKAWYRQGYKASGATCVKGNPWLNDTELADIVNAALVLKNRSDDRITPVTTGCGGGNPYSHDELRNAASPYGGINSVSSVSVLQGNGITNEVVINGTIRLSGIEFKGAFNLRAPGYLRIPQGIRFGSSTDFAFFNIEKK